MNGHEVLRQLRLARIDTPILILSGDDGTESKIKGFGFGADDYLTKDVSLPHLVARIAALFRRVEVMSRDTATQDEVFESGPLRMDSGRFTCHWQGDEIALTLTEFWMIYALTKRIGHVKSRQQLMEESRQVVDDGTITSHIKRIRKKFVDADPDFDQIETVYGMGYRWKVN